MKRSKKETPIAINLLIALMTAGVAFIMFSLLFCIRALKVMTSDQIIENYFVPSFIGCLMIIAAIVIVIIEESKRVAVKKR